MTSWLSYLRLLWTQYNHHAHREAEVWVMLGIGPSDRHHYLSTHSVYCPRCGLTRVERRAWVRLWPDGHETPLAEARDKAAKCSFSS